MAVEAHVNPDGTEKACTAPFNLVGPPHICDGKARSKPPSHQPTPMRLTPEPPPPREVTSVEASAQTIDAPSTRLAPAASNVASSSKTKLDAPASAEDSAISKRKASASPMPGVRDEKRSKREESASIAEAESSRRLPNGSAQHDLEGEETHEEGGLSRSKSSKRSSSPKTAVKASVKERDAQHTGSSKKGSGAAKKKKKKQSDPTEEAAAAAAAGGESPEPEEAEVTARAESTDRSSVPPTKNAPGRKPAGSAATSASKKPAVQLIGRAKGMDPAAEDVVAFVGHTAEVFSSAWNPSVPGLIASAGGDATVRIWDFPSTRGATPDAPAVCKHLPTTHAKDVSALEWNPDGTLLASGSYDGILRLWTPQGDLHLVMSMHQGPIFAVRWNKKGTMLLTSSADGTAIVWDLSSGKVKQQYPIHSDSVLDVDWLVSTRVIGPSSTPNNFVFATASADNSINLCRVGETKPIRTLRGHDDEVNAVRFDCSQTLLASASDDKTAKIWTIDASVLGGSSGGDAPGVRPKRGSKGRATASSAGPDSSMDVDRSEDEADADVDAFANKGSGSFNGSNGSGGKSLCKFTLTGHTSELFAMEWAPTGPGSANPHMPRMLATTSFDKTARIWNGDDGSCLRVIADHSDSVYSICWSPDALFLATGGIDSRAFVTRVADGEIVKAFAAGGPVFDVSWHVEASEDSSSGAQQAIKSEAGDDVPDVAAATAAAADGTTAVAPTKAPTNAKQKLAMSQGNRVLSVLDMGAISAEHGVAHNGSVAGGAGAADASASASTTSQAHVNGKGTE